MKMIHFSAHKKIEIQKITALMTITIAEKRPDIACLLENLENPLLSGGERKNLSIYLESLGLLKNRRLTKKGEIARQTSAVLIPESGVYEIYFVKTPVPAIPSAIIHFKRIEPDKTITASPTVPFEAFEEYDNTYCTSWYHQDEFDVRFERPGNECPRVIVGKSLSGDVQLIASEEVVSLTIQLSVQDGNKVIKLEKNETDFSNFSLEDNIERLITGWDSGIKAIRMSFKDAQKGNIVSTFSTGKKFADQTLIFRQGSDDTRWNISIDSIPVVPLSEIDAEEWVYELTASELEAEQGYRSSSVCLDIAQKTLEKTPIYDVFPHLNLSTDEMKEFFKGKKPALSEYIEISDDLYPEQYITT